MPLHFKFSEFERELENFSSLAEEFLDPSTHSILAEFRDALRTISRLPHGLQRAWTISIDRPVKTLVSKSYEIDDKCAHAAHAEISCIWEIEPLDKPNKPARLFALVGKASTRLSIKEGENELARWRMEIASDGSPGCHFHTQVLGDQQDAVFPHSLPVPRLPSFFITPTLAIEFVLGELFQAKWAKHVSRQTGDLSSWSGIQHTRMLNFLSWQQSILKQNMSPLYLLKQASPPTDLFVKTR